MRAHLIVGLVLIGDRRRYASAGVAQAPRERVDTEVINKIKEEGLKKSKVMETISFLTDVHGPRLTASPQMQGGGRVDEGPADGVGPGKRAPGAVGAVRPRLGAGRIHGQYGRADVLAADCLSQGLVAEHAQDDRGEPVFLDAAKEEDLEKYRGKLRRAIVLLSPPREVKALFDPPARRQTDATLLALANGESRSRYVQPSNAAPTNAPTPARSAGSNARHALWRHRRAAGLVCPAEPQVADDL